ncbi:restriction alleviation protein, Lar family [Clostridiales bacterium]|nr:restriction alleviation protein, Lar family [Clostridiales bacterium]
MNEKQRKLAFYKALRKMWTKKIRAMEVANENLDEIIKSMEREEPRFLLDKDSICYGCPEYKNIMDCDLTDPWNHWGEGDGNGGVCDTVEPCYAGSRNTYKKKEATEPLPCPFCGGEARSYEMARRTGGPSYVRCGNCGTETTGYPSKEKAIAAWNRRDEKC